MAATMLVQAQTWEKPDEAQVIAHELGEQLPSNAIVTSDSGTITTGGRAIFSRSRARCIPCSGTLQLRAVCVRDCRQLAHPIGTWLRLWEMAAWRC